jgi:hypothetical protein
VQLQNDNRLKERRQAWPHQHACVFVPQHPPHKAHEATDIGGLLPAGGWAEPPCCTAIPLGLQMLLEEGMELGQVWQVLAGLHTVAHDGLLPAPRALSQQPAVIMQSWAPACSTSTSTAVRLPPVQWPQLQVPRGLAAHLDAVLSRPPCWRVLQGRDAGHVGVQLQGSHS